MGDLFRVSTVNRKTPRMSHRFNLRFEGLTDVLGRATADTLSTLDAGTGTTGYAYSGNLYTRLNNQGALAGGEAVAIQEALELSLLSVSVPSIEMETVEVARFHDTVKHIAKFTTMGDMNVTFYDYVDGSASAIMFLWHNLVGDKRTGAISYKEEYTLSSARLIEYGPKAPAETADEEYTLAEHMVVNIYPKTIELGEHSYESAEIRKVQVTFAVDNIYPLYYRGSTSNIRTSEA